MITDISDDKEHNRYRLEHKLIRVDGLMDWSQVLESTLNGPDSQFLFIEVRQEQTELTRFTKEGEWQFGAVATAILD